MLAAVSYCMLLLAAIIYYLLQAITKFSLYLKLDSTMTYYFPSIFHIFITLSKRTWSTENEIYKKFKWIPFKIDSIPWNGLLKRHLWRRMIDM